MCYCSLQFALCPNLCLRLHHGGATATNTLTTYVLALKGVEEVSTQLPVIPRGPGRIANAT